MKLQNIMKLKLGENILIIKKLSKEEKIAIDEKISKLNKEEYSNWEIIYYYLREHKIGKERAELFALEIIELLR